MEARLQLRHELAVRFADYEARHYAGVEPVDKDPEGYVKAQEQGLAEGGDGSLSVGSLKKR